MPLFLVANGSVNAFENNNMFIFISMICLYISKTRNKQNQVIFVVVVVVLGCKFVVMSSV